MAKRDEKVDLYLTADEKAGVAQLAEVEGMAMSPYIRTLIRREIRRVLSNG